MCGGQVAFGESLAVSQFCYKLTTAQKKQAEELW